jgi:type I restriction enzyme S subunit
MSYQIPHNIDLNKIFLVNRSEIEGRLDPSIYRPQFKFISNKYKNVKLSEIAWIDPTCNFGKTKEVSFVPMDAIDSVNGTIAYKGVKTVEETKGFTRFKEGDLLWAKITPCMQNAKSAIAKKLLNGYGCGSTEFFVIRAKDEKVVSQEYLLFLLRDEKVLKSAMNYFGGSAGQQRVSPLFLKTFNVPLPDINEQNRFCEFVRIAQKTKKQKEIQAEALLCSIDDYLLGELGLKLPEKEKQTLQDRIFIVNKSVIEDRLDPY